LVVQAALFAGFLSAFLIELLSRLEPDPLDVIQDVLIYQTQMMRNSSLGPYVPVDFSPPEYIVIVNALFYASLGVMLLAAFIAMLIKSWVREFDRGLRAMSLPEQRAKTREFRFLGMERWKLPEMVGVLPLLIQISLFLFSIGLILFLFHISKPSFGITTAIFGIGILYHVTTTSISVFATSSPFHSPLSRNLATLYRRAHARFCPETYHFLLPDMDTIPVTDLGRVRRAIQILLQKSRPYIEKTLQIPTAATTVDELQLSTAASALQRIHDSAPNSQHSEALHWSVWQVAGSTKLRIPPVFDLPSWILDRGNDEDYFSSLPQAMLVALVAASLRADDLRQLKHITTVRSLLQRMENPNVLWAQVVTAVFDHIDCSFWIPYNIEHMKKTQSNLMNVIRGKELPREESLWLLSTLSELRLDERRQQREPFLIEICLAILSDHAPKWDYVNRPDMVLLDAVVILATMSCCPNSDERLDILYNSRDYPWLLPNIRNPALFGNWLEDTPPDHHKQLISLLLLIVYGLIYRRSYPLAVQYFTVITAKGDLPLYTSALTAIAPAMKDVGLSAIGRMLVAPHTQELTGIIRDSMYYGGHLFQEELLQSYDHRLGANEKPDPNFIAIVFMLSKHVSSDTTKKLEHVNLDLKNPWLRLVARVVARLDIPDGSGMQMESFYDVKLHNMVASLSLLRYTQGMVTHYTDSLLLASLLESRELPISSVALEYYMKTMISHSDPPAPPSSLSRATRAVFNLLLPDHQLWMGWTILGIFVDRFETLSVEWRRSFADGFFTLSRRPLLKPLPLGDMESTTTPESELKKILTWEYFHQEEQERTLTDSEFSGLDWMAMAWSLHLAQHSGREKEGSGRGKAQSRNLSGPPTVNGGFVLRALCELLDSAPPYQILPIIPKLHEIVQWFDDTELPEYRCMISTHIKEAVRRQQEFNRFHRFHKFHCMWNV